MASLEHQMGWVVLLGWSLELAHSMKVSGYCTWGCAAFFDSEVVLLS